MLPPRPRPRAEDHHSAGIDRFLFGCRRRSSPNSPSMLLLNFRRAFLCLLSERPRFSPLCRALFHRCIGRNQRCCCSSSSFASPPAITTTDHSGRPHTRCSRHSKQLTVRVRTSLPVCLPLSTPHRLCTVAPRPLQHPARPASPPSRPPARRYAPSPQPAAAPTSPGLCRGASPGRPPDSPRPRRVDRPCSRMLLLLLLPPHRASPLPAGSACLPWLPGNRRAGRIRRYLRRALPAHTAAPTMVPAACWSAPYFRLEGIAPYHLHLTTPTKVLLTPGPHH